MFLYVCMWSTSLELFFHFMIILIIAMKLKLWFDWYVYGWGMTIRLDLHFPGRIDKPKPVVIFVTGGAWIIGHRAWGSLFGKQLAQHGIIVASIDYRNYPHGTASNMVADICSGIAYVCANIARYGGDPEQWVPCCLPEIGSMLSLPWYKRITERSSCHIYADITKMTDHHTEGGCRCFLVVDFR
jgi:hypothetical protein